MTLKYITLLGCFLIGLAPVSRASGEDYHGQDLSGKHFDNQILNGANFSDATLKGATFTNASLKKAIFKGADLTGAAFGGDLTGADLRETVGLDAAGNLTGANLEGVTFTLRYGVKLRGANLKKSKITFLLGGTDFSGADLRGANLRALSLGSDVSLRKAIYDEDTAWPDGFDPTAAGAVLGKPDAK